MSGGGGAPRGRPRKPTALHRLNGNPGKRRLPGEQEEPQPSPQQKGGRPWVPASRMDQFARTAWARLQPMLADMRVMTEADVMALELLVSAYAEYWRAVLRLRREGMSIWVTTKSGGYQMPNPAVRERNDAWRRAMGALQQFGLTPSSRARVTALPKVEEDPFSEFEQGASP